MSSKVITTCTFALLILIPFQPARAVTQNQIVAEVQIVCPDDQGNWFSGSGTLIDSKGIILTNRHVVTGVDGTITKTCFIGFTNSINQEPDFGTKESPNLAEVKFFTTTKDMDAAILYLSNPSNKVYPYVDIWNSDSDKLTFGDKLEVIGYPAIGGSTITYTSGDFSGFGNESDDTKNYIKTTAALEHGNSGGAAYEVITAQYVGVPTMVVVGQLNSLSYILSINSIKNWLYGVLGNGFEQQVKQEQPNITKPALEIKSDFTPPDIKGYKINYKIINNDISKTSSISYYWNSQDVVGSDKIAKYFYYFGDNVLADPIVDGKSFLANDGINTVPETFSISDTKEKYFTLRIQDSDGNVSQPIVAPWSIKDMIAMGAQLKAYQESTRSFTVSDQNIFKKYSGQFVKNNGLIWLVNAKDGQRHLIKGSFDDDTYYGQQLNGLFSNSSVSVGILTKDLNKKPKNVWGALLAEKLDDGVSMGGFYYINPRDGKMYDFSGLMSGGEGDKNVMDIVSGLAVTISTTELNKIKPANPVNSYYIQNNLVPSHVDFAITTTNNSQNDIKNSLLGFILLQVESHGEAWYVNPTDGKRYYMKDGLTAYQMMRSFGLGVSEADYSKIENGDATMKNRLKGRIILRVEQHGEAYWIDPKDLSVRYLQNGNEAYQIMRLYSLGITNANLEKILSGVLN